MPEGTPESSGTSTAPTAVTCPAPSLLSTKFLGECLITRPECHELGIGTRSHPSEQCPPGPEPHGSSLCIHPFPSPVDMQGETLLLQN